MIPHAWRMNGMAWPVVGETGRCATCGQVWTVAVADRPCRGYQIPAPILPAPGAATGTNHLLLDGGRIVCLGWDGVVWVDAEGNQHSPDAMAESDRWIYGAPARADMVLTACSLSNRPAPTGGRTVPKASVFRDDLFA